MADKRADGTEPDYQQAFHSFLELIADETLTREGITYVAEKIGVSRITIYNWLKRPEAVKILNTEDPSLMRQKILETRELLRKRDPKAWLERYEPEFNPKHKMEINTNMAELIAEVKSKQAAQ